MATAAHCVWVKVGLKNSTAPSSAVQMRTDRLLLSADRWLTPFCCHPQNTNTHMTPLKAPDPNLTDIIPSQILLTDMPCSHFSSSSSSSSDVQCFCSLQWKSWLCNPNPDLHIHTFTFNLWEHGYQHIVSESIQVYFTAAGLSLCLFCFEMQKKTTSNLQPEAFHDLTF